LLIKFNWPPNFAFKSSFFGVKNLLLGYYCIDSLSSYEFMKALFLIDSAYYI